MKVPFILAIGASSFLLSAPAIAPSAAESAARCQEPFLQSICSQVSYGTTCVAGNFGDWRERFRVEVTETFEESALDLAIGDVIEFDWDPDSAGQADGIKHLVCLTGDQAEIVWPIDDDNELTFGQAAPASAEVVAGAFLQQSVNVCMLSIDPNTVPVAADCRPPFRLLGASCSSAASNHTPWLLFTLLLLFTGQLFSSISRRSSSQVAAPSRESGNE